MVNRVPVYCDICMSFSYVLSLIHSLRRSTATRVQVALNVAVPAASLCINRQLYRVAKMKTVGFTDLEKRRNLIYDLLIGVGIPFLQMIARECTYPLATNPLYTRTQSRIRCFREPLRHIRGLRPLLLYVEYAPNLCPLFCMARSDWHCVSLLLW